MIRYNPHFILQLPLYPSLPSAYDPFTQRQELACTQSTHSKEEKIKDNDSTHIHAMDEEDIKMPHELVLIYNKLEPKDFREALCKWHVLCIIWYTSINIS